MGRLVATLLLAVLTAWAAPGLAADPADEGFGIKWLDLPEGGQTASPTSALRAHVAPGSSLTRLLEVRNVGTRPLVAEASLVAADVTGSRFTLLEEFQSDLTGWATVEPAEPFEVAPGGRRVVRLEVAVPEDAPDGERVGALLVSSTSGRDGQVGIESRVGLGVYVSVGEGEAPPLNFSVIEVTARRQADGLPVVDALVENTGGRALSVSGATELREGPGGLRVDPVDARRPVALRPGEQGTLTFIYAEDLPDGPWVARVRATAGLLERVATATITFPSGAGEAADPVPAEIEERRRILLPVASGLLGVALALLLLALFRRRQRAVDEAPVVNR